MKKTVISLVVILLIASGCSNKENQVTKTPSVEQGQSTQETVFTSADISSAKELSKQYVSILTSFHGRSARTTQELDQIQKEMMDKIKKGMLLFQDSSIYRTSDTKRNNDDVLELNASSFQIGDKTEEIYYTNIDAHELIVPMIYTKPGTDKKFNYELRFVKTLDNEVQLIKDGFYVSGPDLKKKDNEAYEDSYKKPELQQEVKQELRIK
ncbi:hypothetical protein [Paenibacillus kribbensis]|uniref:hypothetical protein n=1 Tax=Paenibacillus kribbensis TaxID=172713 RepID=UPI00083841B8|nr:hypothetical protein [Paenibacillus kribbensis]